jgi:hypothetical protein
VNDPENAMSASALVLAALMTVVPSALPDDVKLKDGKQYTNLKLVKETPTHYTFADLDDKKITIAKDQVDTYEKKPTVRDVLKDRLKGVDAKNAEGLWELAGWAKAQGLPKDEKEVLEMVIKADPEHAQARAALDHVKYEGAWVPKKDLAAKLDAAKGEQLKGLGYKLEGGKWVSPGESARNKLKLVQVGRYWVTPEEKKTIEAKGLEFREGDWLNKDDLAKWKDGQRKIKGIWKPILDADAAMREAKSPWVLRGAWVEVRGTLGYEKVRTTLKAADDAVSAAVTLSGVEPDVWTKPPLLLILEKDLAGYKAAGHGANTDWAALRSADGIFYDPGADKGAGAAITYFHDEAYASWWGGRGGFEAFVGRVSPDITKLDQNLLDAFAAYCGSFVGDKYHPVSSAGFLFVKGNAMRPASKMFEGFKRTPANELQFRQLGFLVHFLVKKNPETAQRAMQKFLTGGLGHPGLIEAVLGKVPPEEVDKEFEEFWVKFRDSFTP